MTNRTLSNSTLSTISSIVGSENILIDQDSLNYYGQDSLTLFTPSAKAVVKPKTESQIKQIIQLANQEGFAIVPSGGRTGLSGGATALNGEVVVSLERMNRIIGLDPVSQNIECQAGVITKDLQNFAAANGLFYPVDYASSGSSQIGGNIATNAGGIKVIRYGMTRRWVSGLTVVTGSGDVLNLNNGLVKNNAGYDLSQLFIGSEGTLGIITAAVMKSTRAPQNLQVMVLGLENVTNVIQVFQSFNQMIELSAFEFFTEQALEKVVNHQRLTRPFEKPFPYYVLLEFDAINDAVSNAALDLFEQCLNNEWVLEGTLSLNQKQAQNLWRLREDISDVLQGSTPYKNDLSVPIADVPVFVERVDDLINKNHADFEVIWFGHIGDGNIHLNILKPPHLDTDKFKAQCDALSEKVFTVVSEFGGSISAEHGIGLLKKPYLHYSRSVSEIEYMKRIKAVFDPNGIMNPGKIF